MTYILLEVVPWLDILSYKLKKKKQLNLEHTKNASHLRLAVKVSVANAIIFNLKLEYPINIRELELCNKKTICKQKTEDQSSGLQLHLNPPTPKLKCKISLCCFFEPSQQIFSCYSKGAALTKICSISKENSIELYH